MPRLRLGTRQSELALTQSGHVARWLEALEPGLEVELVRVVTKGDTTRGPLPEVGGKGLFTEELEAKLLDGRIDLAVHSLKDLPVRLPDGLEVAAYPKRVDPRDVLVSSGRTELEQLPAGTVVLTGSLRRQALVLAARPELRVEGIRGNVDTRLRKWRAREGAALILAAAGLERLGLLSDLPARHLPADSFVPAPGQGILAVETRTGGAAAELCGRLADPSTTAEARAERAIVVAFGADCTLPLGAWAHTTDDGITLHAVLATSDARLVARCTTTASSPDEAAAACVAGLRADGAGEVLEAIGEGRG